MVERIITYVTSLYIQLVNWGAIIMDPLLTLCMILLIQPDPRSKKDWVRVVAHLLCFWVLLVLLKGMRYQTTINIMYCYFVTMLLYTLVFGRKCLRKSLISFMEVWTFYVFLSTLAKATAGVVMEDILGRTLTDTVVQLFIVGFMLVVFAALLLLMKRYPLSEKLMPSSFAFALVLVVCLLSTLAKHIVDTYVKDYEALTIASLDSRLMIMFTGILLYILAGVTYYYCYHSAKTRADNEKMSADVQRIIRDNSELMRKQEVVSIDMDEIRSIRHDLKNQMAYMQIMLAQKDYSHLEDYLAKYTGDISDALQTPDSDNPVVRYVLSLEMSKARQNGINIDAKVSMGETEIEDTDLSALLLNLLDNAIEACVEDGVTGEEIHCQITQNSQYLFITVDNPATDRSKDERRRKLLTAKDSALHGRGTKIIARIAEKYHGAYSYDLNGDRFAASVMLTVHQ